MKIKRILSLLLAVLLLSTCFGGFGALAETGASFSLVEFDGTATTDTYTHALYIGATKTLRLNLDGRSGNVGQLTWGIAGPNDVRPTNGYTVRQSAVAQSMLGNDITYTGPADTTFTDEITLDGTALAAALGITEWTEPVQFFLELTEDGNSAGTLSEEFYLMDKQFVFGDLSHDFAHNDALVGGMNWIPDTVGCRYYDADHPDGLDMHFPIISVTPDNDCFTVTKSTDGYDLYAAKEGTTTFTATLGAVDGITPNPATFTFTDNVVSSQYEISWRAPNGNQSILKNETKSFNVHVDYLVSELDDNGESYVYKTPVDSYTLTAASSDPSVVEAIVTGTDELQLTAKAFTGSREATIILTATGTHNGESFTVTTNHSVVPMDRYGLLEYSDSDGTEIDLDLGLGESIDLSKYIRYTLYTYVEGGTNTNVDVTADTTWTLEYDTNVWEAQSTDPLPVLTRIGNGGGSLSVKASYSDPPYPPMENDQHFRYGELYDEDGEGGEDLHCPIDWETAAKDYFFDTDTIELTANVHGHGIHCEDCTFDAAVGYPSPDGFVALDNSDGSLFTVRENADTSQFILNIDAAVLAAGLRNVHDDFDRTSFEARINITEAGGRTDFCAAPYELRTTRADYYFPVDTVSLTNYGTSADSGQFDCSVYIQDAAHPDGEDVSVPVSSITYQVLSGDADKVSYTFDGADYEYEIQGGFIGVIEFTMNYTDPLTGQPAVHTWTETFSTERWKIAIFTDINCMLPGESRVLEADVWHTVIDENGSDTTDSGANSTVVWNYPTIPGMTFTPNGRKLTVSSTPDCQLGAIEISASVQIPTAGGGTETVATSDPFWLFFADMYFTMTPSTLPEVDYKESFTFTPEVWEHFNDENGVAQKRKMPTDGSVLFSLDFNEYGSPITINGEPAVANGQYPHGTSITITNDKPFDANRLSLDFFWVSAAPFFHANLDLPNFDCETTFPQAAYTLKVGETFTLPQPVFADPALKDAFSRLSFDWDGSDCIKIDFTTDTITALKPGTSEIFYVGYPIGPLCSTRIVVYSMEAEIEDPIPSGSVATAPEEIGALDSTATESAVHTEMDNLLVSIFGEEDVSEVFDGDVEALLEAIENGEHIEAAITVTPLENTDSNAIPEEHLEAFEARAAAALGENAFMRFVDISIELSVNDRPLGRMTGLQDKIEIRLVLPAEMRGDFSYRTFRLHEDTITEVNNTDYGNGILSIYSDQFSTYMIAYAPKAVSGGTDTAPVTPAEPAAPTTPASPATADETPVLLYAGLVLLAACGVLFARKKLLSK